MASQPHPPVSDSFRARLLIVVVLLTSAVAFTAITCAHIQIGDEKWYYPQIQGFVRGDYTILPELAVPPTYFALVALLARPFGIESLAGLRLISLLLSLLSVPLFHAAARAVDPGSAVSKTYLFFFLPILLPDFFVLYSDALAVTTLLLAAWLTLRYRPVLAGLAALASTLVRQTQAVWMLFLLVLPYVRENGFRLAWPAVGRHLLRGGVFLLGLAGVAAFFLHRGSMTLGATSRYHPPGMVHLSNVFFSLFVYAVLFLPSLLALLPRVSVLVVRRPLIVPGLGLLFVVYLLTFRGDHEMNQLRGYLHNYALWFALHNIWTKTLYFLLMAWALLSLLVTPLHERAYALLYPFGVLAVLPVGLVEPRYYLSGFALLLLFRVPQGPLVERGLLAWFVALSALVLLGMCRGWFFL